MKQVVSLLRNPDKESIFRKVKLDYYTKNYDQKKFNAAVVDYVENGLYKRDPYKMIADNKVNFDKFMEPYLSGKSDSTQVGNWQMMKEIMRAGDAVNWAYTLRDAAETVYPMQQTKPCCSADWPGQSAQGMYSLISPPKEYMPDCCSEMENNPKP